MKNLLERIISGLVLTIVLQIWCSAQPFSNAILQETQEYKNQLHKALEGNTSAMNEVGVALAEGKGTRANQIQAVVWFHRAAELGDAHGAGNLGLHFFRGMGVNQNKVLAAKWFMVCHALDALRCQPGEYLPHLHLTKRQRQTAWRAAIVWLRARPDLKNNHGERPWFGEDEYPKEFRD